MSERSAEKARKHLPGCILDPAHLAGCVRQQWAAADPEAPWNNAGLTCPDCGHVHTPTGCTGEPTASDRWAGVSPAACDCGPLTTSERSNP